MNKIRRYVSGAYWAVADFIEEVPGVFRDAPRQATLIVVALVAMIAWLVWLLILDFWVALICLVAWWTVRFVALRVMRWAERKDDAR